MFWFFKNFTGKSGQKKRLGPIVKCHLYIPEVACKHYKWLKQYQLDK